MCKIPWQNIIFWRTSFRDDQFEFINLSKTFPNQKINWNYDEYGKLWTYNLNYFDFLNQEKLPKNEGIQLIHSFIGKYDTLDDGKEPYPTSLRIMNWIKFVWIHSLDNDDIVDIIHEDSYRLLGNLEYHLLANHLLENAFALVFAGKFLNDPILFKKGKSILISQLQEQVLADGGHFELSPMYHQLMLFRVLDTIQLIRNSNSISEEKSLVDLLENHASNMLAWLNNVSFKNGEIPLVNDSAKGINPTTKQINLYSQLLGIKESKLNLKESGYRKIKLDNYESLIDVCNIESTYQPGHSHADTFSYLVSINDEPFIVESGTATYNNVSRRAYERSTSAHNTVSINGKNSSDVWSSFRVAKRATVSVLDENEHSIYAVHDGFNSIKHYRKWNFERHEIEIVDRLNKNVDKAISYIHFHPNVEILSKSENRVVTNYGEITLSGHKLIEFEEYGFAEEFNKISYATVLKVHFSKEIKTKINLS